MAWYSSIYYVNTSVSLVIISNGSINVLDLSRYHRVIYSLYILSPIYSFGLHYRGLIFTIWIIFYTLIVWHVHPIMTPMARTVQRLRRPAMPAQRYTVNYEAIYVSSLWDNYFIRPEDMTSSLPRIIMLLALQMTWLGPSSTGYGKSSIAQHGPWFLMYAPAIRADKEVSTIGPDWTMLARATRTLIVRHMPAEVPHHEIRYIRILLRNKGWLSSHHDISGLANFYSRACDLTYKDRHKLPSYIILSTRRQDTINFN